MMFFISSIVLLQFLPFCFSVCPKKTIEPVDVDFKSDAIVRLNGVKNTNFSFSKTLSPEKFAETINDLRSQDLFFGPYKNIFIPNSVLNGAIKIIDNENQLQSDVFADVIITKTCGTYGVSFTDAMPFVMSDGKFFSIGVIGLSTCKSAARILNIIKANYTNGNLSNVNVYLGPSARSPNYYVGASVLNQFTAAEKAKYFVELNGKSVDAYGNVVIHKKDQLDGLPRYGFDFSVYFKDGLINNGIKPENIVHDQQNVMLSNTFASVRAAYNEEYNKNPYSNITAAEINAKVGRNLLLVLF